MDLLLNPNVAYLLLVFSLALAILAVLAPGTGVLEVAALVGFILAGWAVVTNDRPVNLWAVAILVLGIFPFLLALRKSGRLLHLAISILALIIGSAYLFQGDGWMPAINPLLALVVSVLVAVFFWLVGVKSLEASLHAPSHSLEALIGATGEARTDIGPNDAGNGLYNGSVYVNGELWSAHSHQPIPNGSQVRVVGREGFTLTVEKT